MSTITPAQQAQKCVSRRRVAELCVSPEEVARVLRQGRTLVNCDVDVVTPDGEAVAKAIATYKVG